MAARYWVGGSGVWNDTGHWSTTSGGGGGSSVPVSSDDVFIDNNSGSPIVDSNGQIVIVSNLHIGSPSQTFPGAAASIKLSITGATTSIGILGTVINIYGDGQIVYPDYNRILDIVTNVTLTNYSLAKLPVINVSNAATLSIAGRYNFIPVLKVLATGGASTANFTATSSPTHVVGYISTGAGCRVNFGGTGTVYWTDQIIDDSLAGAPANAGYDGSGTTVQSIDGLYNLVVGTHIDIYPGGTFPSTATRRFNKTRMDFNFTTMLDGGVTAKSVTVDYVNARFTGRNRFSSFTLGSQTDSQPLVWFAGNSYLGNTSLVGGELVLEGVTLSMESLNRTATSTSRVYVHGGAVTSPFTGRGIIELYGTATLVNMRFKDITVSHKQIVRMDGYDFSNFDTSLSNNAGTNDRFAQCFTASTTAKLHSVVWYLDYSGSVPTGNMIAHLYSTTGTVGTNAIPSTFLAQSVKQYCSDVPSTTKIPFTFVFYDQDAVTITSGNDRGIAFVRSGGTNSVRIGLDGSTPSHAGNYAARSSGIWSAVSSRDICFELYGSIDDSSPGIYAFNSVDAGGNIGITFGGSLQRQYVYRVYDVYDTNQTTPLGVIPRDEIISDFTYSADMNSIAGPLTIRRAVDPETVVYNGDSLVNYNNTVKVDVYGPFGSKTVYRGFISGWQPHLTGTDKYVDVTVLPYSSDLAQTLVTSGPTLDVTYTNTGSALSFTSTRVALSWTTSGSGTTISGLDLYGIGIPVATSGTTPTNYTLKIYKDNGSNTPDNTAVLYTSTGSASPDASGYVYLGPGNYQIVGLSASVSSKYWVVLDITTPTVGQTFSGARTTTSNTYANGNFAYWNGASWVNSSSNGVLSFRTWRTSPSTTVSYSTSLASAANSITNNYAYQGGRCTIYFFELDQTSHTLVYTFQNQTVLDAINIIVRQAGDDWYWYDDPGNARIVITRKSTGLATNPYGLNLLLYTQDKRYFAVGKDVNEVDLEFTIEQMVNDLIVIGGDTGGGVNLFREYISTTSVSRYGRRQRVVSDSNLTDTTVADIYGASYIRAYGLGPVIRSPLSLISTYPFEFLHPGLAFQLTNTTMGGIEYQISRLDFRGDECQVTAGTTPTQVTDYTAQNTAQIDQLASQANPTSPTVVVVT